MMLNVNQFRICIVTTVLYIFLLFEIATYKSSILLTMIITRPKNEDKLLVCSLLPDLQPCLHRGNDGAVRWINDILFRTSSRNVVEKESCISKETATLLSSRDPVGPGSG